MRRAAGTVMATYLRRGKDTDRVFATHCVAFERSVLFVGVNKDKEIIVEVAIEKVRDDFDANRRLRMEDQGDRYYIHLPSQYGYFGYVIPKCAGVRR